jgi:hypothetical protein
MGVRVATYVYIEKVLSTSIATATIKNIYIDNYLIIVTSRLANGLWSH